MRLRLFVHGLTCASIVASSVACSSPDTTTTSDPSGVDDERDAGRTPGKDAGKDASRDKVDARQPERERDATTTQPRVDSGDNTCAGIRKDAPAAQATPVDVIFLIDTSGSMDDEKAKVQANIASFVNEFASSNADTHVVMITDRDPAAGTALGNDSGRYFFIPSGVDSKALYTTAMIAAPLYAGVLRKNAVTHFVMVTDDNDILPPDAFRAPMEATLGHSFTLHAVASESVNGRPCTNPNTASCGFLGCGAAAVGANYYALAAATGGETISICTDDWSQVFGRLKTAVIEAVPLPCDYPLAEASSMDFDKGKVQVVYTPEGGSDGQFPKATSRDQCGDKIGWFYDDEDAPSSITLCPAACEQVQGGGVMEIAFGCEPDPILI